MDRKLAIASSVAVLASGIGLLYVRKWLKSKSLRTIMDFEEEGKRQLSTGMRGYFGWRAGEGQTQRDTRQFLDSIRLMPRILTGDVEQVDTSVEMYNGVRTDLPVIIAPSAFHEGACPNGELDTALAAKKANIAYSFNFFLSNKPYGEVLKLSGDATWLHLYVFKERFAVKRALKEAEEAKQFNAVVVTCDHPHNRVKNRQLLPILMAWLCAPFKTVCPNAARMLGKPDNFYFVAKILSNMNKFDQEFLHNDWSLSWEDIRWVAEQTTLPIIVKGVLHPDDARKAIEIGAKGIVVSNHGARQMDCAPPAIEVLPEIIQTVDGQCDVYVDSGFRSAMDILKAICIGAKGVLLGRPILYALACGGEQALTQMLACLKEELEDDLRSLGVKRMENLSRDFIYWKDRERIFKKSELM